MESSAALHLCIVLYRHAGCGIFIDRYVSRVLDGKWLDSEEGWEEVIGVCIGGKWTMCRGGVVIR